jgi:hypothetical protein
MLETTIALGIMAITLGLVGVIFTLIVKVCLILGEHTRDIKYIKQTIGMNCCNGCEENGLEDDRPGRKDRL